MKETELIKKKNNKQQKRKRKQELQQEQEKEEKEENEEEEKEKEEEEEETDNLISKKEINQLNSLNLTNEEKKLLSSTLEDDLFEVIKEMKYFAPLSAILFSLIGIYLALDPFTIYPKRPTPMSHDDFKLTRPVLSTEEMANIYVNTMYAETIFELPSNTNNDLVSLKFHTSASKYGHFQPPEIFYSGVMFAISSENSHNNPYANRRLFDSTKTDEEIKLQLYNDLLNMEPKPTSIFNRTTRNNETQWDESGYAVYFSTQDLETQGYLSSDYHSPWKRTVEPLLKVARKYRQIYVTQWYSSKFGRQDGPELEKNKHQHETIVRQIIPTRTGLNNIKSTCAVWLWSVNGIQPFIEEKVIIKEITDRRVLEAQSIYHEKHSILRKIEEKNQNINFNYNEQIESEVEVEINPIFNL